MNGGLDFHATPTAMVDAMLAAVHGGRFDVVADPAAGDGRLLVAGQQRFPEAQIIGVDVDSARADALSRAHPDWCISRRDFLAGSMPLPESGRRLVLMNPPFSGRGGTRLISDFEGETFACSRAMAFLLEAATTVGDRGEVVALVPTGVLTNEKDAVARARLASVGELSVVAENPPGSFPGVSTRTAIVRWLPGVGGVKAAWSEAATPLGRGIVWVTRGCLPVHIARAQEAQLGGVRFVHTRSHDRPSRRPPVLRVRPRSRERIVASPCVLIPRVGAPSPAKVVVHEGEPLVLSDCLFAFEAHSVEATGELYEAVIADWHRFAVAYGGSCAPFLRLSDAQSVLRSLGRTPVCGPAPIGASCDSQAKAISTLG